MFNTEEPHYFVTYGTEGVIKYLNRQMNDEVSNKPTKGNIKSFITILAMYKDVLMTVKRICKFLQFFQLIVFF